MTQDLQSFDALVERERGLHGARPAVGDHACIPRDHVPAAVLLPADAGPGTRHHPLDRRGYRRQSIRQSDGGDARAGRGRPDQPGHPGGGAVGHEQSALHHHADDVQPVARGYAPRRLGELNARGVPLRALLLSSIGIALAAVLNALLPESSFILMISVSMFGALFTWLMIFVTHLFFRRKHPAPTAFRMWGYPYTSAAEAILMLAVLITTAFTREFRMTLIYGVPFIAVLTSVYHLWYRRRRVASGVARFDVIERDA